MPYGVSFAAAAAIASSPSEFRGVMRCRSVVFWFVVGFGANPGTGLRRRGMARFEEESIAFPDIRCGALREISSVVYFSHMFRGPSINCFIEVVQRVA